jgi:metal-responsive CopG/Arc/MetJ family transcriptional regulator
MGDKPMQQITVRLTDDLLEAIDVIIDEREGQTERGAVIRELISRGLKSFAWEERLNKLERKRT